MNSFSQPFVVTTEDGGLWHRWRPGHFRSVHCVVLENGFTFDCWSGSRKHRKTPEELAQIHSALKKSESP